MDFEKIGRALGKAVRETKAKITEEKVKGTPMYRTNLRDVPKVEGLQRREGWVDMQVQFLIDKRPPAPTTSSVGPCSSRARGTNATAITIAMSSSS